jgi:hypothetical protein
MLKEALHETLTVLVLSQVICNGREQCPGAYKDIKALDSRLGESGQLTLGLGSTYLYMRHDLDAAGT